MSESQATGRRVGQGEVTFPNTSQTGIVSTGNFILPRKTSSALKIRLPLNGKEMTSISRAKTETSEEQGKTPSSARLSNPMQPSTVPMNTGKLSINSKSSSDFQSVNTVQGRVADIIPPASATRRPEQSPSTPNQSSLDIYAKNYVPIWLEAINESFASPVQCLPLNSINFAEYISTFAGNTFLSPLPQNHLPPTSLIAPEPSELPLSPGNYCVYFLDRLRREIAAQTAEIHAYSLFNAKVDLDNARHQLFRVSVPGIREYAPRIDLGDIVLVRPILTPYDEARAAQAARAWYDLGAKQSGLRAPSFSGLEYHAVVWGVDRARELLVLRIDRLAPILYWRCNMVFTPQVQKIAALFRSVEEVGASLATPSTTWMRSMLFPDEQDGVMQTKLPPGKFDLNWYDAELNYQQQKAVHAIVSGNYGSVPYLISGPPGTGKTKTIVEAALQLLAREPRQEKQGRTHLLLCAPSDAAADTLATRLKHHLSPNELFRLNSWTRSFAEVPDQLMPYCFSINELFSLPDFRKMMSYKVVVASCRDTELLLQARLTNASLSLLATQMASELFPSLLTDPTSEFHWTGLLLDEAAQSIEPEALIPISVIAPGYQSEQKSSGPLFVMAGDEFQLGPRLTSKADDGLEISLFERLFRRKLYADHPLSRSKGPKSSTASTLPMQLPPFSNLIRNYRSHHTILSMPSILFYYDTLVPECTKLSNLIQSWPEWKADSWPVLFHQNHNLDQVESILDGNGTGAGGIINEEEARIALYYAQSLQAHSKSHRTDELPLQESQIMVMSPFRAQVKALRISFRNAGLFKINIGPVETFQGLEARVVILCTTRTRLGVNGKCNRFVRQDQERNLGVIDEPKRFNVAITRAKEGLIVIGNQDCLTCTGDKAWESFIAFCHRNGRMRGNENDTDSPPHTGGPIGRLERAQRYADRYGGLCIEPNQAGLRSIFDPQGPRGPSKLLKGNLQTLDEEMWTNGNQAYGSDDSDDEEGYWGHGEEAVTENADECLEKRQQEIS